MNLGVLDNILWAAGFIGHAALLLVLLLRRRWRQFPGRKVTMLSVPIIWVLVGMIVASIQSRIREPLRKA